VLCRQLETERKALVRAAELDKTAAAELTGAHDAVSCGSLHADFTPCSAVHAMMLAEVSCSC
jgi:hypothetical protein